ncbi:MAG: glycogen/starch/alpha-glucan phosphorylase [Clostridia bacterium]|nr:glycogen/starch/alpha-glucan phosphorylase [Clostridia bacterium]MBO7738664.1 glycogen/starch/alpha-glucan phosphorylase [Clostridia bacterium]
MNTQQLKNQITATLARYYSVSPEEANAEQIYSALAMCVRDVLAKKNSDFSKKVKETKSKRIYYICMEFLMGRQLKMNLCNLGLESSYREVLSEMGFDLDEIYDLETDPALGNGGLGRLAACFMDALATQQYPAKGFSILFEYGLFRQKMAEGEQLELPDIWLPSGQVWLVPRQDKSVSVKLGGKIKERWDNGRCEPIYEDYDEIDAVPYDMFVSGADSECCNTLRLWKAQDKRNFNMEAFSQGQYIKAVEENTMAETISKVLYPADNHHEGKLLRLSQQYFLVSASLQNIVSNHVSLYKTLDNFAEKVSIHINDTHPALCVPELMRILMDDHHYSWEKAWEITVNTISYTNHTVLPEALECWNEDLFRFKLPRIHNIVTEINRRFCADAWNNFPGNWDKISRMAILGNGQVRMANLSVVGSNHTNGVSKLHSDILKKTVFRDYADMYPERFTNVTNGIAHRKWLCYSNPRLASLLDECIGEGYRKDASQLEKFLAYENDESVLKRIGEIKRANKVDFANYISSRYGTSIDPDSIFDVQAKRLHEYKRQLLNALNIISLYTALLENPSLDIRPQTFIFGAKAAPGYYLAKDILRLICYIAADIEKKPALREKIRVVFLENYNVTLAERLMPAADVSEQISLAGKEASGTGNMKFMINGAVTIGTLDGANVEIAEQVGDDNVFIFGLRAHEVDELWKKGYSSSSYYLRSPELKRAIDRLAVGFNGRPFTDIANYLLFSHGVSDPYMCLADFEDYHNTHNNLVDAYGDTTRWNKMALNNIAKAGIFAADRSIRDYAENIWNAVPLKD